jgi:ribose-phosphate pyrophosphokinase
MELLIMVDALKRASASSITAVIPYYGYGRQDRKVQSRVPITAKLVADLLTAAGVTRVVAMDLHAGQIQGFFNIPFDHLYAKPVITDHIKNNFPLDKLVIVSPDAGGVERARAFAKRLNVSLAIIDKRRTRPNEVSEMNLIGEVTGKHAIIVDDMIDTAGTICAAAVQLKKHGAESVVVAATHGLFSEPAGERLAKAEIDEIVVTDTVPLPTNQKLPKIDVISVTDQLAAAIKAIFEESSVSALFDGDNQI